MPSTDFKHHVWYQFLVSISVDFLISVETLFSQQRGPHCIWGCLDDENCRRESQYQQSRPRIGGPLIQYGFSASACICGSYEAVFSHGGTVLPSSRPLGTRARTSCGFLLLHCSKTTVFKMGGVSFGNINTPEVVRYNLPLQITGEYGEL